LPPWRHRRDVASLRILKIYSIYRALYTKVPSIPLPSVDSSGNTTFPPKSDKGNPRTRIRITKTKTKTKTKKD
jgi:hypothetical protein